MISTRARHVLGTILTLVIALSLTSCASNAGSVPSVTSVTIAGGDQSTSLGDPLTLSATVVTTGAASTTVTWTSSNETVATIDTNGTVTSHTEGTTHITATSTHDTTKHDTITLTVNPPPGTLGWTRQFGTSGVDIASRVAADADGNVYVSGFTTGDLEGTNAGGNDAFLRAYGP